jgi:hypothetical protein
MHERIHEYLDGDLPLSALSPEERRELESYEHLIRHVSGFRRSEAVPDMTEAVMSRIAEREAAVAPAEDSVPGLVSTVQAAVRWMWQPRPVRLRPAYGLVAAAALFVLMLAVPADVPGPDGVVDGAGDRTEVFVQFRLDAPDASSVRLAGSFTGWQPEYTLYESSPGVWSLLVPLPPGVHDYAFVVDGEEWRPDPVAPRVDDGFGGHNSRVAVLTPTGNAL